MQEKQKKGKAKTICQAGSFEMKGITTRPKPKAPKPTSIMQRKESTRELSIVLIIL
jgi:hypothetical protein